MSGIRFAIRVARRTRHGRWCVASSVRGPTTPSADPEATPFGTAWTVGHDVSIASLTLLEPVVPSLVAKQSPWPLVRGIAAGLLGPRLEVRLHGLHSILLRRHPRLQPKSAQLRKAVSQFLSLAGCDQKERITAVSEVGIDYPRPVPVPVRETGPPAWT